MPANETAPMRETAPVNETASTANAPEQHQGAKRPREEQELVREAVVPDMRNTPRSSGRKKSRAG